MAYVSKNNAYSTLAASITSVATSLQVASGHGDRFPVVTGSDYTYVTLEDTSGNIEIVKVTARASASDTMTIVRAQESTTARAWNSGDVVEHRLTAGVMEAGLNAANDLTTHLADTVDAHDASAISYAGGTGMSATDVEAALDELATEKANTSDLSSYALAADLTAHLADTVDAHDASAISYAGGTGMSATDVEAALDELATEKVNAGAVTSSGLTMATSRLLGRTTASSGAVEEITVGAGLTLTGGALAVSSAGAWELVSTTTVTAVANIDFDLQEDIYGAWMFVVDGVVPSTDDVSLSMRPGYSAGTTFDSANSTTDYFGTGTAATTEWVICGGAPGNSDGIGTAAGEHAHAVVTIGALGSTLPGGFTYESKASWVSVQNLARCGTYRGYYNGDIERLWDSVRFLFSSGNFEATGTIKMYGLKRAG